MEKLPQLLLVHVINNVLAKQVTKLLLLLHVLVTPMFVLQFLVVLVILFYLVLATLNVLVTNSVLVRQVIRLLLLPHVLVILMFVIVFLYVVVIQFVDVTLMYVTVYHTVIVKLTNLVLVKQEMKLVFVVVISSVLAYKM